MKTKIYSILTAVLFPVIVTSLCLVASTIVKAQIISTIAGTGIPGYTGDGGPAINAELNAPVGIALDNTGNLYIPQSINNVVRKMDAAGIITTFAGNGTAGYSGDGGPATSAQLNNPARVATDAQGNVYIIDNLNQCIRMVNTSGIISTVAGNGTAGYSGDGGPALSASFNSPRDVAFDVAGNMYITDQGNNVIRMVNTSGIISTYAGTGTMGYSGDGGPAINAELNYPLCITADGAGNLYIGELYNQVIRVINTAGIINTFAGNGTAGYSGDGGPALSAQLQNPNGVALDATGNIYITDQLNNAIRKVDASGIISTYAGTGIAGYSGDGGPANAAQLSQPKGIVVDPSGNLYISEFGNHVIRKITSPLGINLFEEDKNLVSVYPNPSSGSFTVSFKEVLAHDLNVLVTVNDFTGRKVFETTFEKTGELFLQNIDLTSLPAGVYFLKLSYGRDAVTRKIIME